MEHPDEFPDPKAIVDRYLVLVQKQKEFLNVQRRNEKEIEDLNQQLIATINEKTKATVQKGGSIATKQKELEELENEKERIIQSNEENSSAKMQVTCEHGQILMTINNLYHKVRDQNNWQLVNHKQKEEERFAQAQQDFDDQAEVELKAKQQL